MRSALSLLDQGQESALALEHALIMLLLLVELLSSQREQRRSVFWLALASVALSLLPSIYAIAMSWPLLSALVLPPLLWQVAMRFASAQPAFSWKALLIWLLMAVLIGLALHIGGRWSLAGALLLGALAAALIWQVRAWVSGNTDLGALSQLALALLLADVDLTLRPIQPFLGSLFSGAALGIGLGSIGVRVALRVSMGKLRNRFCLGLAYAAYLLGAVPGASGVALATMTALTVAIYGYHVGLWPTRTALPMPLSHPRMVLLMAGVLLLLGWQADVSLTWDRATGIGLGLLAAALGVLAGHWLIPMPGAAGRSDFQMLLLMEGRVFLLLLSTLLLWPQEAVLEPEPFGVALLAALVLLALLHTALKAVFELLGIELQSPNHVKRVQHREQHTLLFPDEWVRTRRNGDRICDPKGEDRQ